MNNLEEIEMLKLDEVERFFNNVVNRNNEELSKFKEQLEEHPVHAFTWMEGVMRSTAQAAVARHYLVSITNWKSARDAGQLSEAQPQTEEAAVKFIYDSILRQAIRGNAHVERSTSVTSNFMQAEESAFYANLALEWDMLNG